jgi:hypothetical protein
MYSKHSVSDYIEEAAKRREKIKAVSTKYSEMWTDISGSDGIVIDTSRYDMKTTDLLCHNIIVLLHIKSASIVKTIIHRGHDDFIHFNQFEYL